MLPSLSHLTGLDALDSQLFPDQVNYFLTEGAFAVKAISDGGLWVALHSATATS